MSLETSDSDHYPAPLARCPLMLRGWPFLDSLALYPRRQHLTGCCLLPLASGQAEANSQYKEGETRLLDQWLKTMQNVFQKSKMIISSLEDRAVRQNPTKSWRLYIQLVVYKRRFRSQTPWVPMPAPCWLWYLEQVAFYLSVPWFSQPKNGDGNNTCLVL